MKKESDLQRLLQYAGRHKVFTYLSWVLSAASALLALVPFVYIWAILKNVLTEPMTGKSVHFGIMAVVFAVLSLLIYIAGLMCSHLAAFRVATNIRIRTVHHIAKLPEGEVSRFGTGKMRKIISDSGGAAETYLAHQLPDKAAAVATPVGLCVMLFIFDWRLGLLSLIPVVLAFLIMSAMTGKRMQEKMAEYQNVLEDMSNEAVEYVRGVPVVKTFGQTIFSFKKFKEAIDRYSAWAIAYTKELRIPVVGYTTAINSVFAFLIAGAYLLAHGTPSASLLLNLTFYIIITPVISLTLTKMMYMSENEVIVKDALMRIDSILNLSPLPEPKNAKQPNGSDIELKNATHSYDGARNAVENVSPTIHSGETAAFVGPSGGGKTTVSRLAARFWDIQKGKITLGGMDISKIDPETLMSLYSIVFQDVTLFNNTVMENIRIGRKNATDEEVLKAARLAGCDEFIAKLEKGYQTEIGENGCTLSGGERQRLSIARAFLKDAPIILLDEATASLDVENETLVQAALSRLIQNKTVLIIAHRMRTVAGADKIVVLKDGVAAEQGAPDALYEKGGIYAAMVRLQTEAAKWNI